VRLNSEYVYKVNVILLAAMEESVTFRCPVSMLRSIRRYRKLRKIFDRTLAVLPPNLRDHEDFQEIVWNAQIVKKVVGEQLLHSELEGTDKLEGDLFRELNWTHHSHMQNGCLTELRNEDEWALETTTQPRRESWRRSGRKGRAELQN
jgi:hypothetical protein